MSWFNESKRHSMSAKGMKSVQSIPRLNVDRYMGKWYQIKAFPKWFQEGCKRAMAEYAKRKGYIEVKNSCIGMDGKTQYAYAKAYPMNPGKSRLSVDFVGGRIFEGDYWVLYTDYDVALVGSPDKDSLWILSRRPTIAKADLQKLQEIAKNQGFDIKRLK